jgi:hypothetical protein
MSDYIPKDPMGPNSGPTNDRYGNTRFEPADDSGKGPYILLGLLVAIGLIGGLLYFNGSPKNGENVAQAPANPPAISRTVTPPAAPATTPAAPSPSAPTASPATPAPSATPSDSGTKQ